MTALYTIPFKEGSFFREEITLGDTPYIFEFEWNSRGEYWTLHLFSREEVEIIRGIKLTTNSLIFDQYVRSGIPPFNIFILNTTMVRIEYADFISEKAFIVVEVL